jgi:hypothetical protein
MVALPLANVVIQVGRPRTEDAQAMAETLKREVPATAVVSTWEHDMTFLTDHRYRVPPQGMLAVAVDSVWSGGQSVASRYDFLAGDPPDYVLEGPFARGVGLYDDRLTASYELVTKHGEYALFRRRDSAAGDESRLRDPQSPLAKRVER